jgi:CRP-like cAMP-binding protein
MPSPPPLPTEKSGEAPVDRAITALVSGDAEGALRIAAGLAKIDLAGVAPLFLMGQSLRALDQKEPAQSAFELAADRASDSGNLPMAIAALAELSALGVPSNDRAQAISKRYAKDSSELRKGGARPPVVPPPDAPPLPAALTGAALIEQIQQTLEYAEAALESDRQDRKEPVSVSAQGLFSSLDASALRALIGTFTVRSVKERERVIKQGATGAEAFVLARGELEVVREAEEADPILLARLGSGSVFGEMALLSRSPRAASVVAERPSIVLEVTVGSLEKVASQSPDIAAAFASYAHRRMVANLVRTSELLGPLSAGERQALIERFAARTFEPGEKLVSQGKDAPGLYVIASGKADVIRKDGDDKLVVTGLGVGEVVGEVSLVFRRASNADVVASLPTMTLFLPRTRFMEIVRNHPTLLAQLYELAARRDDETMNIAAQEASDAEDLII